MLYAEAGNVSELEAGWGTVQRHATAIYPYLPDTQPEDRYRTFSDHDQIGHATTPNTAPSIHELQLHTVCGLCGSMQTSYKSTQGVFSCDICSTPYHPNDFTTAGWDLGGCQSTDQFFNPAIGLDTSQCELVNYPSWPDATASNSYGGDIDDFSWFMAS